MQPAIHPGARPIVVRTGCAGRQAQRTPRGLPGARPKVVRISLTHPNKEFFRRQCALLRSAVPAGFPSPADDYVEQRISLDEHLVRHRESTFFMRVAGDSMRGLGIFDGDLLVVDRALPAAHGCVVIAVLDGEFTVKQLLHTADGQILRAAHPGYPDTLIKPEQDFSIWGVVSWNIHKV